MASKPSTIKYILELDAAPAEKGILRTTEKAIALKEQLKKLTTEYGHLSEEAARKALASLSKLQASALNQVTKATSSFTKDKLGSINLKGLSATDTANAKAIKDNLLTIEDSFTKLQTKFKEKLSLSVNTSEIAKLQQAFKDSSTKLVSQHQTLKNQLDGILKDDASLKASVKQLKANLAAKIKAYDDYVASIHAAQKRAQKMLQQGIGATNKGALQAANTLLASQPKKLATAGVLPNTSVSSIVGNQTGVTANLTAQAAAIQAQINQLQNAKQVLFATLQAIPAGVLSQATLQTIANHVATVNNTITQLNSNLQQTNATAATLPNLVTIFNNIQTATKASWDSFINLLSAVRQYRQGITDLQKATLDAANEIKKEIADRNALKKAYAEIHPELAKAAALRVQEKQIISDTKAEYKKYQDVLNNEKDITVIQRASAAWQAYLAAQRAAYNSNINLQHQHIKNFEKELSLIERLQQSVLRGSGVKQTAWSRSGTLQQMQFSGASSGDIKAQQLKFDLEDIEKKHANLVNKFRNNILAPNIDAAKIKQLKDTFNYDEGKLASSRSKILQLLGEIEQGINKATHTHKALIARIFDLVVGYRLVNTAVNAFTNTLRSIPEAGLQLESFIATMKAVFSDTKQVNAEMKMLNKLAQESGQSVSVLRESFAEFAPSAYFSNEDVNKINEIFYNLSKAGTVLHLPADKMKSAFTAINQMYAKGQVMMEELKRQLGNQLPAAVNIFAASMGKTTKQLMDDMKKGIVYPKDTILNFSRMYAQLMADPKSFEYASQGVQAHIGRMQTAWTNFTVALYEKSKGGIKGGLSLLTGFLKGLVSHMETLIKVTITLGTVLGVGLVAHIAKATTAWIAYRNALIAANAANNATLASSIMASRASILAGGALPAGAASAGLFAGIGAIAKAAWTAIPAWVKLVGLLIGTVEALKDISIGTAEVVRTTNKLTNTQDSLKTNITLTDVWAAKGELLKENVSGIVSYFGEVTKSMTNLLEIFNIKMPEGWFTDILHWMQGDAYTKAVATKQAELRRQLADEQDAKVSLAMKKALFTPQQDIGTDAFGMTNKQITAALQNIKLGYDIVIKDIERKTKQAIQQIDIERAKLEGKAQLGQVSELTLLVKKQALATKAYEINKKGLELQTERARQLEKETKFYSAQALNSSETAKNLEKATDQLSKFAIEKGALEKLQQEGVQGLPPKFKTEQERIAWLGNKQQVEIAKESLGDWERKQLAVQGEAYQPLKLDLEHLVYSQESATKASEKTTELQKENNRIQTEILAEISKRAGAEGETAAASAFGSNVTNAVTTEAAKTMVVAIPKTLDALFTAAASKYNLPKAFLAGIAKTESGMRQFDAKGNPIRPYTKEGKLASNAVGMMQVIPRYHKVGEIDKTPLDVNKLANDIEYNLDRGAQFLAYLSKKFGGNLQKVAATYYGSESAAKNMQYSSTVLNNTGLSKEFIKANEKGKVAVSSLTKAEGEVDTKLDAEQTAQKEKQLAVIQETYALEVKKQELSLKGLEAVYTQTNSYKDFKAVTEAKLNLESLKLQDQLKTAKELGDQQVINATKAEMASAKAIAQQQLLEKSLETYAPAKVLQEKQLAEQEYLQGMTEEVALAKISLEQQEQIKSITIERSKLEAAKGSLDKTEFETKSSILDLTEKLLEKEKERAFFAEKRAKLELQITNAETTSANAEALRQAKYAGTPDAQVSQYGFNSSWVNAYQTQTNARNSIGQGAIGQNDNVISLLGKKKEQLTNEFNYNNMQGGFSPEKLDEYLNKMSDVELKIQNTKNATEGLKTASNQLWGEFANESFKMIGDEFLNWANGAKSAKQSFKDLAIGFARMIQDMLIQALQAAAIKAVLKMFGLSSGGSVDQDGNGVTGMLGFKAGGYIPAYASGGNVLSFPAGGMVRGKGTNTSDSNLASVAKGSFILNAKATAKAKKNQLVALSNNELVISPEQVANIGLSTLKDINAEKYADGGLVGGSSSSGSSSKANSKANNVYNINVAVPQGTSNPQQFGKDVSAEIVKAIAKEEARKQVALYDKKKANGR